ncbi:MAG: retropepsin-like aspartic protease [Myxococcota bacterium]|nr:retropepsin-like aspartic protease [Myxococcota bacterium]
MSNDPWDPDWTPTTSKSSPPDRSPQSSRRTRKPAEPRLLAHLITSLGTLGLLPGLLALCCVVGVVLRRGGTAPVALVVALALVVLPIAGIWSLLGRRRLSLLLALWSWSLLVLWGTPQVLPGERAPALSEGLAWLAAPLGGKAAQQAGSLGSDIGTILGRDPQQLQPIPIQAMETRGEGARDVEHSPDPPSASDESGLIVLPYEGEGEALRVRASFEGSGVTSELAVLFDTGATITTLDRGALRSLRVEVPADAPTARFQTANGEVESPLVLLNRIWLDETHSVEGVTVAVCDNCAQQDNAGLLGLNVTGLFQTTVDPELSQVVLAERSLRPDRRLDIAHWVKIDATATAWPSGRVEVEIHLTNRSLRPIDEVVTEIECPASGFAVTVSSIPAGGTKSTKVELPRSTNCSSYRVLLRSARW